MTGQMSMCMWDGACLRGEWFGSEKWKDEMKASPPSKCNYGRMHNIVSEFAKLKSRTHYYPWIKTDSDKRHFICMMWQYWNPSTEIRH